MSGGCYTGVDGVTGQLIARRRSFDRVREPPYSVSEVVKCSRDLEESVLVTPPTRECWFRCITEMLLLCNEAAARFARAKKAAGSGEGCDRKQREDEGIQTKPLGLEYMADRLDTDDPIFGYMVRTKREGWLQGFITLTTFTTWHKDFEWNSLVREAGISDDDKRNYRWDFDNRLALALQAQERAGDPDNEGIVWHRVAEVSLLGALGCGAQLLQLLIDELETSDKYDFLILQATDNAIGFYEKLGFTRVGAISKPDEEAVAAQMAQAQLQREAKAAERERLRQSKLTDKKDVPAFERQTTESVKETANIWRVACSEVLKDMINSEFAKKILWPKSPPPAGIAKSLPTAKAALDLNTKNKDARKYKDTEDFVRDVTRLVEHAKAPHNPGHPVHEACTSFLGLFKSAWQGLGEDLSVNAGTGSRFFIYVDMSWESKQGFRLFQVYGDIEEKTSHKAFVQAREWRVAKDSEYSGPFDARELRFVPSKPKPQKLCWTPRIDFEGVLQTETMCVKVAASDGNELSDETGLLFVKHQAKTVALAYTRLHALRALQQPSAAPATKGLPTNRMQQDEIHSVSSSAPNLGGEEQEEAMSEYEMARLERMQENQRLLQATGIMTAVKEVEAAGQEKDEDAGKTSPSKAKRKRSQGGAEPADEEAVAPKALRSKGPGDGLVELMGKKTMQSQLPFRYKKDAEGDRGLSDVETPLKSEATCSEAEQTTNQHKIDSHQAERQAVQEETQRAQPIGAEQVVKAAGADADEQGQEQAGTDTNMSEVKAAAEASRPLPQAERPFPDDARYEAQEDETPRMIAKMFGLDLQLLVKLNKQQYAHLTSNARFRKGTMVLLPKPGDVEVFIPSKKLGQKGEGWFPYCHWTYPDQQTEDIHPSYMMVRKLERRAEQDLPENSMLKTLMPKKVALPPKVKSAAMLQEEASQAAALLEKQTAGLAPTRPESWPCNDEYTCAEDERPISVAKKFNIDADKLVSWNKPLYPNLSKTSPLLSGTKLRLPPFASAHEPVQRGDWFDTCCEILGKLKKNRNAGPFEAPVDWEQQGLIEYPFIINEPMDLSTVESKLLCDMYASPAQVYQDLHLVFDNAMHFSEPEHPVHQMAEKMMKLLTQMWTHAKLETTPAGGGNIARGAKVAANKPKKPKSMFNKVVVVEGGPKGFFFVLHYIPDMQWCHLAQMGQQGYFPKTYKNGNPHQFAGRPQWKLLPEGQGLEVDVSADRCRIVKCITVNRVSDADKEAWDILEDCKDPVIHFPAKTDQAAGKNSSPAQEVDTQSATSRVSGKTEGSESKSLSAPLAKATPISWLKDAQMIISKVRNHKKAWPFLQAVDPVQDECPDYFNLISRPCDLGLIESKLAMQQYDTPTDLVYDLLLTFDNAMVYNPAQNQVHKLAQDMATFAHKQISASKDWAMRSSLEKAEKMLSESKAQGRADNILVKVGAQSGTGSSSKESEEMSQLHKALALRVHAAGRSTFSKFSKAALEKIALNKSGESVKMDCPMSPEDLLSLVDVLKGNLCTVRLDLEGCGLGDSCCGVVAELIVANKRLAELDLQMNQLTDEGVKVLAEAVPKSGLTEIHVGQNSVTLVGAKALVRSSELLYQVTRRSLTICGISNSVLAQARQELGQQHETAGPIACTSGQQVSDKTHPKEEMAIHVGQGVPGDEQTKDAKEDSGAQKQDTANSMIEIDGI